MSKNIPQLVIVTCDDIEQIERLAMEHELTTQYIMNEAFSLGLSIIVDEPVLLKTATDSLCDPLTDLTHFTADEKRMYYAFSGMMHAAGGNK